MPPGDWQVLVNIPCIGLRLLFQWLDKGEVVFTPINSAHEDKNKLCEYGLLLTICKDKIIPWMPREFWIAVQIICFSMPVNLQFVFHLDESILGDLDVIMSEKYVRTMNQLWNEWLYLLWVTDTDCVYWLRIWCMYQPLNCKWDTMIEACKCRVHTLACKKFLNGWYILLHSQGDNLVGLRCFQVFQPFHIIGVISTSCFSVNSILLCFLVELVKLLDLKPEKWQDQAMVVDSQDLIII